MPEPVVPAWLTLNQAAQCSRPQQKHSLLSKPALSGAAMGQIPPIPVTGPQYRKPGRSLPTWTLDLMSRATLPHPLTCRQPGR